MCGRYTLACEPKELVEEFDLPGLTFEYFARHNVAPGQAAPVVAEDRNGRRIGLLTWGLLPRWMSEPRPGFINARSETVSERSAFRDAFQRRRCLVPADGFYEWRRDGGRKTPFWLHAPEHGVVSFAGVWESWDQPGHDPRHTFVILTTDANEDVRPIHPRMPVVIQRADRDLWLDHAGDPALAERLLRSAPEGTFRSHAVSTRVNRPAEDDPGLIEPVAF